MPNMMLNSCSMNIAKVKNYDICFCPLLNLTLSQFDLEQNSLTWKMQLMEILPLICTSGEQ